MSFVQVAEVTVDPTRARVYEHGWQSWSPTGSHPLTATAPRPADARRRSMRYRPGAAPPAGAFQGEGVLAIDSGTQIHLFTAADVERAVPSIRATSNGPAVVVAADGQVAVSVVDGDLDRALGAWADDLVHRMGVAPIRPAPTVWCSWYHYFTEVTEADVAENLAAIVDLDLPVDVVQIDDGWQAGIGDWLTLSDRFTSLDAVAGRVRDAGLRAGIWVAPFLVGAGSSTAADQPDWLVAGPDGAPASAGHNWGQDLYGLDVTHPGAADYVRRVFEGLRRTGFDYFKIDFVYAAALPGARHDGRGPLDAYRHGLRVVREAIGADAYLLGCGAPILPSVGLVDAMRVSADVAPSYEPADGDLGGPSQRGATLSTASRAWQHGRFWVNDPDCLLARPAIERREDWARVVERYGGLRASSDRIADLDDWGLDTTRRLLSTVPPPTPFP
ncbi:glycoside hydrolase family 36 protein [Jiangella alkaliphila]|uniref:Alpha-galactosidase n=1 Tax=Jiangella alkaliphila TaxID=419479 RepID=A0A1H2L7H4_9ACTN|nr:glycoside hydrolase family 36 protein [Jiangella alkaliphila]SDU76899.1 alpha-galactosidase [Jiangella alkaliphila]